VWDFPALCVYDWSLWDPMLIRRVAPTARYIAAEFDESPQHVAARLPSRTGTLLVHLDISHDAPFIASPEEFIRVLTQRDVQILNALCYDIRKRTIQACCRNYGLPTVTAAPDGPDDELLIIKTDMNCGGEREQKLPPERKARLNLPETFGRMNGPDDYFVAQRGKLGQETWEDSALVVEQYVTNTWGRFYRIYVALDAVVISEAYSDAPVKRIGSKVRRDNHWLWRCGELIHSSSGKDSRLPPALLRTIGVFVHRFHFDFGAIDMVESNSGDFYVVDANKTPNWHNARQAGVIEHLRMGFLKGTRPITGFRALVAAMKQKLKDLESSVLPPR
jgi:hypothetical protein